MRNLHIPLFLCTFVQTFKTFLKMNKILGYVFGGVILLLILLGMAIVMAVPTYYLWNWLMPKIFQLPEITLFEALGINLLSGILFKSSSNSNNSGQ